VPGNGSIADWPRSLSFANRGGSVIFWRRKSILLVSRDPDGKQHLESSGFSVVTASMGPEALDLFKSRTVDAVVFDQTVEELEGLRLTEAIKQLNPRIPVVILSESAAINQKVCALVDAMVLKTQAPEMLSTKLESLIKIRSHSHRELEHEFVVFSDPTRRYLDCTDGVCQLLGYTRMELTGMTIDDASYRPQKAHGLFEQYVNQGKLDGQYILRHKTGKPIFIEYRAEVFSDGCMAAVWSPVADWKQLYQSAMMEFDSGKLKDRLELAQHAVEERMRDLIPGSEGSATERQQLQDALSGLRVLARELPK
jgi:CheY-like chemotaxis protein